MRSGNEKPAGNTLCIVKGFEAAWAFFCPAKPCLPLSTDGIENGLNAIFPSRDAIVTYICGYARGMLRGGFLRSTGERHEGFIAYKLPGEKLGLKTVWPLLQGFFRSMNLKELSRFAKIMKRGGPSLRDRFDKEKKPYVFVGMVCVREQSQGQGYMRKVMDMAFAEGRRLGVPVILDTDAKSKCDKYVHLGMELAGIRDLGEFGKMYDLIKYPDSAPNAKA